MNTFQSADQIKGYYNNVVAEIMKGPDASRWLQAMQLNMDNNPVYLGITDGPDKQVQPAIPVETALKMKAYISYQLALETLKSQQFLAQWYQYTLYNYEDVYAFGGINKIGVPNVMNTYMYLVVPNSNKQVNAWLIMTAEGNLSVRKWVYALYGAELPSDPGGKLQGPEFNAYQWNKECFEWLFQNYVAYMKATAPKVTGRGSGMGDVALSIAGKGVGMVTGRAGNPVEQVTDRAGSGASASAAVAEVKKTTWVKWAVIVGVGLAITAFVILKITRNDR